MSSAVGTQLSTCPKGIPLLPGNTFQDPTKSNFKKTHHFDVKGGISCVNPVRPADAGAAEPPPSAPINIAKPVAGSAPAPVQPAWVAFDRKVLRFNCYFKESVHESRLENYRVRNCVLYYYLGTRIHHYVSL